MKNVIFIFLILFMSLSYAEGPNYNDTVDFIKSKTNIKWSKSNKKQLVDFDKCTMYVYRDFYGILYVTRINLKYLDPSRVKVEEDNSNSKIVVAYTKGNKRVVNVFFKKGKNDRVHKCSEKNSPCTDNIYYVEMSVIDPGELNAPKLSRALSHLIKLCGGKSELF